MKKTERPSKNPSRLLFARFVPVVAFWLAMTGCSTQTVDEAGPEGVPIGFGIRPATRASVMTDADITDMGVFGYYTGTTAWSVAASTAAPDIFDNQKISKSEGNWSYLPVRYWPAGTTSKTSFFAYSPHSTSALANGSITPPSAGTAGEPLIGFTVPADVADQVDLLRGTPQTDKNRTGGTVTFLLKHALTKISFVGRLATGESGKGYSAKVTRVGITGIKNSGTLNLATGGWTFGDGTADYSVSVADGTLVDETFNTETDKTLTPSTAYLLLPPQALGDEAFVNVTVEITGSIETTLSLNLALSQATPEWEAGIGYVYRFEVAGEFITIDTNLTPWTTGTSDSGGVSQ